MKVNKPNFWNKKFNLFVILFLPITFLFYIITYFKRKIIKPTYYKTPIICVGNIYVGGTGKTPTSIWIENELNNIGKKAVIIKKFYKSHYDEHNLINEKCKNLILNKSRHEAIRLAENKKFDYIILDDGFQDCRIKKDLNILCFNQSQLIGNGFVFPAGPLREGLNSIKEAHIILINGKKDEKFESKMKSINKNVEIIYSYYNPKNLSNFKDKRFFAFSGIGNTNNFFNLLSENNINIIDKASFPDHYEFSKDELERMIKKAQQKNLSLLTTEKDYLRINKYNFKEINFLEIELVIREKEIFLNKILELND